MKFFLCSFLLLFAINSFAQNGSVEGQILDNSAKDPLEYASISLLNATNDSLNRVC